MEKEIREIKKMADFQMRKATHIQFLENCVAEALVPKGLRLNLQVEVGNNNRLQNIIDRVLEKTSLEICRMIKEEHVAQLHESKHKMMELENKLRSHLSNEGQFNEITAGIFKTTEDKKNTIEARQKKKITVLKRERNEKSNLLREIPARSQNQK
jgi:hypothetical protein